MNFEDERYVRVYTRDTSTWQFLRWEGQSVFVLLLRKVDRVGVFDLAGAEPAEAVSAMLNMPEDIVRTGLERLLKYGVLERGDGCLVVARYIEAQEASMSPAARQMESRLRRRDQIRSGLDPNARGTVIYFIQSEHGGPIKIGRAEDLAKRLVGLQTSRPDKLIVLASAPGTVADERALHERFSAVREKGEWFSPSEELMSFVRAVAQAKSIHVTVTIRDSSQGVTGHDTSAVTPFLAVPSRAVPSQAVPEEHPSGVGRVRTPKPPRVPRWRRVPAEWEPNDAHRAEARELGVNLEFELKKFRDHEFDRPKSDADATFRNWLRTALERSRSGGPLRLAPRPGDQSEENIRKQLERVRQLELEEARRQAR